MNIVVFGHSGVERREAVRALVECLAARIPRTGPFHGLSDEKLVPSAIVEDEIELELLSFLDLDDRRNQQRLWNTAARQSVAKLNAAGQAVHRVLAMHATYYRQSQVWSCLDPSVFASMKFQPDVAITLIDDVQNVQSRLNFRPESSDRLRLRELVAWRNIEISDADLFLRAAAKSPPAKNFVVGIRHPVDCIVDLVATEKPTIYSGHPISHILRRSDAEQPAMVKEIEDFKEQLRSLGAVLDPATIDELALVRLREREPAATTIEYSQRLHWPVRTNGTLAQNASFPDTVVLRGDELDEVVRDVRKLVHFRDYRLMDQSDCLVSYRPNWDGVDHGGVVAEYRFAKMTGMPRLAWTHPNDPSLGEVFQYVTTEAQCLDDVTLFLRDRVKSGRRFRTLN